MKNINKPIPVPTVIIANDCDNINKPEVSLLWRDISEEFYLEVGFDHDNTVSIYGKVKK